MIIGGTAGLLATGAGTSAAAAGCPVALAVSGPADNALVVTPALARARAGECVALTNATASPVSIEVSAAGAAGPAIYGPVTLAASATTRDFVPASAGRETLRATVSAAHIVIYRGVARLQVTAAPSPSPSPTRTSPAASPSPTHRPTRRPSTPSSTPPAASPSASTTRSPTAAGSPTPSRSSRPRATGIVLPTFPAPPSAGGSVLILGSHPLVAGAPTSAGRAAPSTSPTPSAVVVAGVIEPAENNRRGLPIAVAIVLVVGLAAGFGRVVLAHPAAVDSNLRRRHRI